MTMTKLNTLIFHPAWVSGFIDGEGTFYIGIIKNTSIALGYQVQLQFTITQHIRDNIMIAKFVQFFNGGLIVSDGPTKVQYRIRYFYLIPALVELFEAYPLQTQKRLDWEAFLEVYKMMLNKEHLTQEGLDKIRTIKDTMNRARMVQYKLNKDI